jgi:hypothetical protein
MNTTTMTRDALWKIALSLFSRRWYVIAGMLLAATACRSIGASVATPVPVPVATSYVAPLVTTTPTAQPTVAPTPQPEDDTSVPSIITVEPAASASATP